MILDWKFALAMTLLHLFIVITSGSFYYLVLLFGWYHLALDGFDKQKDK